MMKEDSLLNKAYDILGYESESGLFKSRVPLSNFVKVILSLSLNERREKAPWTPPKYVTSRRSVLSGQKSTQATQKLFIQ